MEKVKTFTELCALIHTHFPEFSVEVVEVGDPENQVIIYTNFVVNEDDSLSPMPD